MSLRASTAPPGPLPAEAPAPRSRESRGNLALGARCSAALAPAVVRRPQALLHWRPVDKATGFRQRAECRKRNGVIPARGKAPHPFQDVAKGRQYPPAIVEYLKPRAQHIVEHVAHPRGETRTCSSGTKAASDRRIRYPYCIPMTGSETAAVKDQFTIWQTPQGVVRISPAGSLTFPTALARNVTRRPPWSA